MRTRELIGSIAVLACLLTGCGDGGDGGNDRGDRGDEAAGAEPMEIEEGDSAELDNGDEVRVSSRADQEIWVQYRPDGGGWEEPEEVYSETGRWTHEVTLETAGNTVAINAGYWAEKELDDDYLPQQTVQVICHEGECSDPAASDFVTSTSLSDNGEEAWLPVSDTEFAHWSLAESATGVQTMQPPGYVDRAPYWVQDDGSLTFASPISESAGCRLSVSASEPGSSDFEEVAATETLPWLSECELDADGSDGRVVVFSADMDSDEAEESGALITLVRDGDWNEWTIEEPEAALVVVPDTNGSSTISNHEFEFGDGSTVVLASPDQSAITVQRRAAGSEEWSPVEELAVADPDTPCTVLAEPEAQPDSGALIVAVQCGGDSFDPEGPSDGFLLATTDGIDWSVQELQHPRTPVWVNGRVIGYGSNGAFEWDSTTGRIERLPLEIDGEHDVLAGTPDRSALVLFSTGGDPATCRPTWSVGSPEGDWSDPTPLPGLQPAPGECRFDKAWVIEEDGREITRTSLQPISSLESLWTGAVVENASGELEAVASEDLP